MQPYRSRLSDKNIFVADIPEVQQYLKCNDARASALNVELVLTLRSWLNLGLENTYSTAVNSDSDSTGMDSDRRWTRYNLQV